MVRLLSYLGSAWYFFSSMHPGHVTSLYTVFSVVSFFTASIHLSFSRPLPPPLKQSNSSLITLPIYLILTREICVTFQAASQVVVSGLNVSRSFVGCLLSTIVLMFVGPWSDCSGRRKPLLILPLLGMCIMTTSVLILLMIPGVSTAIVLYAVQIPISVGGNFGLLSAAAFSHIGDVSIARLGL